jgi:hypothetical protein
VQPANGKKAKSKSQKDEALLHFVTLVPAARAPQVIFL